MFRQPADITWLIETPSGRAGFSVFEGNAFLHYEHNPHDMRIPLEVRRHSENFFQMVKNRGFDVAYSVVPAADIRLNKFQSSAGMEFFKEAGMMNVYRKVL